MADCILVNSNFTAETFFKTFTTLTNTKPEVLYPSLNFEAYDAEIDSEDSVKELPPSAEFVFLSINRFERKKNLQLALEALGNLKDKISTEEWKKTHLIMAGNVCPYVEPYFAKVERVFFLLGTCHLDLGLIIFLQKCRMI